MTIKIAQKGATLESILPAPDDLPLILCFH